MTKTTAFFAGIDIFKETLDLAFSNDDGVVHFANTKAGCRKPAALLIKREPSSRQLAPIIGSWRRL